VDWIATAGSKSGQLASTRSSPVEARSISIWPTK
jgi:hypothetical protein